MNNPETVDTTSRVMNASAKDQDVRSLWADISSLIKTGIIYSNLMTAFAGFWLALYFADAPFLANWPAFVLSMAGTAFIIAGGCIINNYYDRDIDQIMSRTKQRPTVTGTMSLQTILVMGIIVSIIGVILLSFTTWTATAIGIFGWFAYVVLYTMWSKRRYTLNTAIGSLSGAVPPLIGWAAIDPNLHFVAWVLFLIMFIWQTPHFLALAMKKTDEYGKAGIPMLPVVHGFNMTKRQIIIYVACLLPLPFYLASLGTIFTTIAIIITVGWFVLGVAGFFMKNDLKWASLMFVYSLNYLTIMFVGMVVATLPPLF
ncbi:protoheme IX farnesyltransferase [Pontibacillus halophilus JSM 076056 = DSM 19796]|uniref:Protoheme IX farnesyltransferase n=1 Tax=Pontibacillus halophilus JSM 076056 = DSM 19796 TaxID=1385510 RepID=A0A0A5GJ65_9BACI|nr:heme o synthase [Pontibacillus halophilus]KGX93301.1 protoheme IX farnesyltransferase [Pontibacillus halophilus JSM 076056 = DSM 19796]